MSSRTRGDAGAHRPRLALGYGGGALGFWTGSIGNGAYFSNLRYAADPRPHEPPPPPPDFAPGTILSWELSSPCDASAVQPVVLPDEGLLRWDSVRAEPDEETVELYEQVKRG